MPVTWSVYPGLIEFHGHECNLPASLSLHVTPTVITLTAAVQTLPYTNLNFKQHCNEMELLCGRDTFVSLL